MLPVEFLRKLISTQDEKAATWLDGYLKAGAALLDRSVREGMELSNAYHKQLTEHHAGRDAARAGACRRKRPEPAPAPTPSRSEIDELRRRLDELAKDAAAKGR